MKVSTVDLSIRTFVEKSDANLAEGDLVGIYTDGTVYAAPSGNVIGIMQGRLTPGLKNVSVILFARTARVVQDSAIAVGARVQQKVSAPTRVETAAGGLVFGQKIQPATSGAQGDIIEVILDAGGPGKSVAGLSSATGILHGNTDNEIGALTFTAASAITAVNPAALTSPAAGAGAGANGTTFSGAQCDALRADVLAIRTQVIALVADVAALITNAGTRRTEIGVLVTKSEELADDVRSLRAGVIATGVPIVEA